MGNGRIGRLRSNPHVRAERKSGKFKGILMFCRSNPHVSAWRKKVILEVVLINQPKYLARQVRSVSISEALMFKSNRRNLHVSAYIIRIRPVIQQGVFLLCGLMSHKSIVNTSSF